MNWKNVKDRLAAGLRERPVLAVVIIAGLIVAAGMWVFTPKAKEPATAFYEVRRGDFTVSVVEGGTLTAVNEISIRNEVEGVARIIYIVPEGTYVKKGDLLVELDSAQAEDTVNQQKINYEKARFAFSNAVAQLEIQRSTTNSDITAAALKLKFAEIDLQRFLQGQLIVDQVEASNKLVSALAQLAVSEETYTYSSNLAAKGYETKQRADADRLSVMNVRNSAIVASNTIWILQNFDHPKSREKYESDAREARRELDRIILQSERRIAQYVADLMAASNTLVLNERQLERAERNLSATKIYAPQDGLVVYPMTDSRFSSESLIEEGATVRNRQELIKLPDTSKMKVTVRVHESHVGMVKPGQVAFVVLDSMPDQRFQGYVDKVALLPDT
ncbi:MAG TPA: efflux RND transporter periplasmic adaptor subunit, partial [Verrucomicrobiota bacterium]|nr:efflux RND transporter periplasmic adaptor subunit [Verrucomicrobiota bacterium]